MTHPLRLPFHPGGQASKDSPPSSDQLITALIQRPPPPLVIQTARQLHNRPAAASAISSGSSQSVGRDSVCLRLRLGAAALRCHPFFPSPGGGGEGRDPIVPLCQCQSSRPRPISIIFPFLCLLTSPVSDRLLWESSRAGHFLVKSRPYTAPSYLSMYLSLCLGFKSR